MKKIFHKSNNFDEGANRVTLLDTPTEIVSNKGVKRVTLLDIPEEIVRYIAKYLMIEDVLHLSMTCKILYHMLPKYSFEYKKLDFSSIASCPSWQDWQKLHFNRSSYFDSSPLTSHIIMATISGKIWRDSDSLNIGPDPYISIQLIRPQYASKESIVIASHHCPLNSLPYRKVRIWSSF